MRWVFAQETYSKEEAIQQIQEELRARNVAPVSEGHLDSYLTDAANEDGTVTRETIDALVNSLGAGRQKQQRSGLSPESKSLINQYRQKVGSFLNKYADIPTGINNWQQEEQISPARQQKIEEITKEYQQVEEQFKNLCQLVNTISGELTAVPEQVLQAEQQGRAISVQDAVAQHLREATYLVSKLSSPMEALQQKLRTIELLASEDEFVLPPPPPGFDYEKELPPQDPWLPDAHARLLNNVQQTMQQSGPAIEAIEQLSHTVREGGAEAIPEDRVKLAKFMETVYDSRILRNQRQRLVDMGMKLAKVDLSQQRALRDRTVAIMERLIETNNQLIEIGDQARRLLGHHVQSAEVATQEDPQDRPRSPLDYIVEAMPGVNYVEWMRKLMQDIEGLHKLLKDPTKNGGPAQGNGGLHPIESA